MNSLKAAAVVFASVIAAGVAAPAAAQGVMETKAAGLTGALSARTSARTLSQGFPPDVGIGRLWPFLGRFRRLRGRPLSVPGVRREEEETDRCP